MRVWKLLFAAATLNAAVQGAVEPYAHASATESNVFLGQVFNLDVVVRAAEKPDAPDLKFFADFNAQLLDAGQKTSESDTWLYRYSLRARREGSLQIPALRFGAAQTKPLPITAAKPEPSDRMRLDLTLSKSTVYLGEPVLLTAAWDSTYPFSSIKAVDFHFPALNDKRFQVLDLYEPEKESQAETTGLPVHGTRILATRKSYQKEEVPHQVLLFSKLLIPKKTGNITLHPATLLCAAELEQDSRARRSAFQYPAYFDNTFFDQNVSIGTWSRIYTESTPLELEVKPLPVEGRPALFNGMVGNYSIKAEAEPLAVRVGDPVTLSITVTTAEYMENIFFPSLSFQPLLANRFKISSDRSLPQRNGKSKIYTQTIRPLSADNNEIPPIQLAYFSPASNAYITIQTDPIPLQVSPAEASGLLDGSIYKKQLHEAAGGIRQNYEHPDMLLQQRIPLFGWAHPLVVIAILLLPPLTAGGISLFSLLGEKRHHIHRTAKAARACKVFRKNVAHIVHSHSMKSEIYSDLDQILRAYLGDRLHLNPGSLSFRDAERKLLEAGAEDEIVNRLRELFMVCEAYRFTSGFDEKADAKAIVHNAIRVVKQVEKSLK